MEAALILGAGPLGAFGLAAALAWIGRPALGGWVVGAAVLFTLYGLAAAMGPRTGVVDTGAVLLWYIAGPTLVGALGGWALGAVLWRRARRRRNPPQQ